VVDRPIGICALDKLPEVDSAEGTRRSSLTSGVNRDRVEQHGVKLGWRADLEPRANGQINDGHLDTIFCCKVLSFPCK
jgi:hypothetical protein